MLASKRTREMAGNECCKADLKSMGFYIAMGAKKLFCKED